MATIPRDTTAEAARIQIELLRRLGPGRRLALIRRIRDGAEAMAMARLMVQYPGDSPRRLQLRLASLRYGDELMKKAFGWDPEIEGR